MTDCIGPSPLSDDDLLDEIDGTATEAIHNHLRACAHCSERLELFRKLEQEMQTLMYRSSCPPAEELADYVMTEDQAEVRQNTERHLQTCVLCQREVQKLQTILTPVEAPLAAKIQPESLWEQVKNRFRDFEEQLVTILVPQPLVAVGQLRGAGGLKGVDDRERVLNYEHESITVMLRLEKVVDGLKINGTILDLLSGGQWANGHAELSSPEQKRFIAVIDDDESFIFNAVTQGLFQLNIYAVSGRILRLNEIDLTL